MLAETIRDARLARLFADGKTLNLETKYDGERLQIHKASDGTFRCFSRNNFDTTNQLADSLLAHIAQCFSAARNCIVDGELVAFNRRDRFIATKIDHSDSGRASAAEDGDYQPCFVDL